MDDSIVEFDYQYFTRCEACVEVCPTLCIVMKEERICILISRTLANVSGAGSA